MQSMASIETMDCYGWLVQWGRSSRPGCNHRRILCRSLYCFNGARDYSRDIRHPRTRASQHFPTFNGAWNHSRDTPHQQTIALVRGHASMEPGLLPGYTVSALLALCGQVASMEPGITPGIHYRGLCHGRSRLPPSMEPRITPGYMWYPCPRASDRATFNGTRDYSRDIQTRHPDGTVEELLQWSPGSLPGYTIATSDWALKNFTLQWSPGLLPGYTALCLPSLGAGNRFNGARDHSRDTHLSFSVHITDDPLQWSPGSLPGYTPWGQERGRPW